MRRERKELAVGTSELEAIGNLDATGTGFNPEKHEVAFDEATGLWSVYHRRRKTDRTIKRPISRETREPYRNGYGRDRRRIIVTLLPREFIETRLKGTRRRYAISWHDLYAYLVRRHALAVMRTKQSERAARRKAKREARKRRAS